MSLIRCPECGNSISDKAEKCPHCGLPAAYFFSLDKEAAHYTLDFAGIIGYNSIHNSFTGEVYHGTA